MASAGGAEPPPGGVVRNSALSFVASAQTAGAEDVKMSQSVDHPIPSVPAGLQALCEACSALYPDQQNPLQVTTRLKYWLGGHDPLDYISMYWNPGKPDQHIPPHWHYVSFGLSDLHGDGRVHPPPDRVVLASGTSQPSGYGFELTFRLSEDRSNPPLWPAALLQALARYVFTTGNKFCAGDHISWHAPLDGATDGASRVRHLLVAADPQLDTVATPHGTVGFLQMVGCTSRELRAAQRGSGFEVLKLMGEDPNCGGSWLVTKVRRRASARKVRASRSTGPAHLAGVSCRMRWEPWTPSGVDFPPPPSGSLSPRVEQQIKDTLQRGLSSMSTDRTGPEGHTGMSTDSFEMSSMERALPHIPDLMQGSWRGEDAVEYLEGVHLILNPEGASLLPLAIDGRVRHSCHFTWRCGAFAATVLSPAVAGAVTLPGKPYALSNGWLQMLIPKDLALDISSKVRNLSRLAETDSESSESEKEDISSVPLVFQWPRHRLKISVVPDHELL